MGLLDDAIREHLDLKRRRGADPTEIERAEREALGPVRRSPEPAEDLPDHPLDEELLAHEPGEALPLEYAEEEWEPLGEDAVPQEQAPLEEEDLPRYEPDIPSSDAEGLPAPEPEPGPAPYPADHAPVADAEPTAPRDPAEPARPAAPEHLDKETEEYELEPEDEAEDDMLESTPEFLQDAPDHDRLWFEQRPPRDFDFDG